MASGDHLRALACIARTLRDPNVPNLLRAAQSRESLYVILCGNEEQQWSLDASSAESMLPLHRKHR
jgi:hypothetical protein